MRDIKLIVFDLDGTVLTTDKKVTERTQKALQAAVEKGIAIVPATGRYIKTVPEAIKNMSQVTHFITINGACVFNAKTGEMVYKAEIPIRHAIELLDYLDKYDVVYDCYTNNRGFMTKIMKSKVINYVDDDAYIKMMCDSRELVDDLRSHLITYGHDVQKLICYTNSSVLRQKIMENLAADFDDINISSSNKDNIEINDKGAHKGIALRKLAEVLGIDIKNTMAFGDGLNDVPLLEAAGVSVCMSNGTEAVKKISDIIAPSNDDDGVAYIIESEIL